MRTTLSRFKGEVPNEVLAELRMAHMAPLDRPTRDQLKEELHLITVMSVIIDLVAQGWRIECVDQSLTLSFPKNVDAEQDKQRIRHAHLIDRDAQLAESSVAQFVSNMEKRRLTKAGWHSIFSVMRDGQELAAQLTAIQGLESEDEKLEALGRCIQPYLQFVKPGEICEYTGLRTNDIWRYFRHTWVNSYRSVPGRSMMILVRDAATPNHPVIGIAALGSSVVQQSVRDEWIGWDGTSTLARLKRMPRVKAITWILGKTRSLIRETFIADLLEEDLITGNELRRPTDKAIARLLKESDRAIAQHRLYPEKSKHNDVSAIPRGEWKKRAREPLFRSKRAKHLAKLLKIRLTLQKLGIDRGIEPAKWNEVLESKPMKNAVTQLIRQVKAERVGINMMDITVCGAIAPYNHLLGGKLVCMLLCSPEVATEFSRRYSGQASLIASAMSAHPIRRSAELVLLCTTSLYGSGLSQYSRVRIPAGSVGGRESAKIEYKALGASEGFGSFHFSKETLRLFGMVIGRAQQARKVNSIFGEGVNPLMRKIRDAMAMLGLPGDVLLRHGNKRVVYGVALADNFDNFLGGFSDAARFTFPRRGLIIAAN